MSLELYGYQSKAVEGLRNGIRAGHHHQILQSATGSGKTVMATHIIQNAEAKGVRTLFLADSIELVDQAAETFDKFGLDVGVMQGNHWRTDESRLTQVCTPQTLQRRIQRERHKFERYPVGLVIHDESHVQYRIRETLKGLYPDAPVIGLTATPFSKGMGLFYTHVVSAIAMKDLIRDGYLCNYRVFGPSKPDMKGVGKNIKGDYKEDESAKRYDAKLVADIVETWKQHGQGRSTLGFACNVAESRKMAEVFREAGINSEHIDGYGTGREEKDARTDVIKRFKAGEIDVLWNCLVLTKGFDSPRTSCLIIARPTKSLSVHFQIVGRGLRTFEGKEDCIILDHAGNFDRLMFPEQCESFELDGGERDEPIDRASKDKPDPCKCGACGYTQQAFFSKCPECQSEKTKILKTKDVLIEEGELVEIKPKKEKYTDAEKQQWYSSFVQIGIEKKYQGGWAYVQFKKKFKHDPKRLARYPINPIPEARSWIVAQNIRYAKGRAKSGRAA